MTSPVSREAAGLVTELQTFVVHFFVVPLIDGLIALDAHNGRTHLLRSRQERSKVMKHIEVVTWSVQMQQLPLINIHYKYTASLIHTPHCLIEHSSTSFSLAVSIARQCHIHPSPQHSSHPPLFPLSSITSPCHR